MSWVSGATLKLIPGCVGVIVTIDDGLRYEVGVGQRLRHDLDGVGAALHAWRRASR